MCLLDFLVFSSAFRIEQPLLIGFVALLRYLCWDHGAFSGSRRCTSSALNGREQTPSSGSDVLVVHVVTYNWVHPHISPLKNTQ